MKTRMTDTLRFPVSGFCRRQTSVLASALLLLAALRADAGGYTSYLNLAYGSVSSAQKLDLFVPTNTSSGPFPLIVRIHVGGFSGGGKGPAETDVPAYVARGYAAACINYRLSGEALFPAAAQDTKAAVRWLRAHASAYHLDTNRFAAWGESSGGWLAVMLGVTGDQSTIFDDYSLGNSNVSSAVQAVIDWFGAVDFGSMDAQQAANPPASCPTSWYVNNAASSWSSVRLGAALTNILATVAEGNLTNYIVNAKYLAAFLECHGNNDCTVPYGQAVELNRALTNRNAISSLNIESGWSHGDSRFESTQVTPALNFLDKYTYPLPTITAGKSASQLNLSWPAWATNFNYTPQWTSNLLASNSWATVTNTISITNGTQTIAIPAQTDTRFFRLAR
jgi:acetyl esterase/lipase